MKQLVYTFKLAICFLSVFSDGIYSYPAYMASDCGFPSYEKKAATYERLDKDGNTHQFYTELYLKRKSNKSPGGYYLEMISSGHDDECSRINPCYEKNWISEVRIPGMKTNSYLEGVYSVHFWKRPNPKQPASFYNSIRKLNNITSCYFNELDWDTYEKDQEQL